MKRHSIILLIAIVIGLTQTSCYINNQIMLKSDRAYVYDKLPDTTIAEYILSPNDILEVRLFANKGFLIIDISSGAEESATSRTSLGRDFISYPIYSNGDVKLPIINYVNIVGKTIKEAEKFLENIYSEFYVDPYVQISVVNKRVIVFPGSGSDAKVIPLINNNMTLLEAIALAGGITIRGKANKIKLIRNVNGKKDVYLVDLSDIDNVEQTGIIVQANDIIYIEPVPQIAQEILQEVAPIVSLLSSLFLIYFTINNLK